MRLQLFTRIILPALIITASSFQSFGYFPDSTFLPYADSLFALESDTQITARRIKKDTHTYFMVTTCKTIQQPYSLVVSKLQHFKSYPDYFTFIMKVAEVEENNATDPATMFVGHYGLYRVYFFGKIREEYSPDSGKYRVFCGDVEQKKYRKAWRRRVRGLIKIGSHDVDIFWTVEKRGDAACRVSLTASQAFTTRIPNWMVSIGTNKIFRGMLKDLEKYLAKTGANPTQPTMPPASEPPAAPSDTAAQAPQAAPVNPPDEGDTQTTEPAPADSTALPPAAAEEAPAAAQPEDAAAETAAPAETDSTKAP